MKTRKSPKKYGYRCRLCQKQIALWSKMKLHLVSSHWDQIKAIKKFEKKDPVVNPTAAIKWKLLCYSRLKSTSRMKGKRKTKNIHTVSTSTEAINQVIQLPVQIHINLAEALAIGCAWFGPPQENET